MNKRHWITLAPGDGIDETLVEDLVGNAYDLVVAGLPRAKRPLDPTLRTQRPLDPTLRTQPPVDPTHGTQRD